MSLIQVTLRSTCSVSQALRQLEWVRTTDKTADHCVMKWTETVYQVDYTKFREGEQMVSSVEFKSLMAPSVTVIT